VRAFGVACALALTAGLALAGGDEALLPASNAIAGWELDGKPRVFTGSELYGHIDGGAEIFFEFSFEQLTVQRYRSAAGELAVECYRMDDALAALGIYLGKCGRETPDPLFAERHTAGRYQLMFVRDRYFVIVDNPAGTPALATALVEFARFIAARLPASRPGHAFDPLPAKGLVEGSQRLIRGPVALQAIVTLGSGDILQLRTTITAVSGEYTGAQGRHALIVVTYPDVAAAGKAFRNLVANLDPEITPLHTGEACLVFRDYDGTFGVASLAGARLEIQLHLQQRPPLK
jgi:hypothetical protein